MDAFQLPVRSAAVLGAGTMGAQIAAHLANAGLTVHLLDLPGDGDARNSLVDGHLKTAVNARPNPFFTAATPDRITTGNLEDDFGRVAEVDWVIESIVERLEEKQELMARLEEHVREDAIVSSNTSGIPIRDIVEGRGDAFKKRVLGTHFFNPPRYLELLEVIPTADTDPAIAERVATFGRVYLGKGIVVAKDVPYFIGNRIGIYSMLGAMGYYSSGDYSIAEIDTLTGPLVGRPKSGTFRTADLVGLDVMVSIGHQCYKALPNDESRDRFQVPAVLLSLVARGALGAKAGEGFYKKDEGKILSLDAKGDDYQEPPASTLEGLGVAMSTSNLARRMKMLFVDGGRVGSFVRATTLDTIGYASRRLGEIADSPHEIDQAMRWGFGWEMGPFQMWDALGFEMVRSGMSDEGVDLPTWADNLPMNTRFYKDQTVFIPNTGQTTEVETPADELSLASIKAHEDTEIWATEHLALLDLGDGVACLEFRTKANSMGIELITGLVEAIDRVEQDKSLRGLIIGNEGKHFSVGANLKELMGAISRMYFGYIDNFIAEFQAAMQRVHYAAKPIVVAVHQRALGGGTELVMACDNVVAAAESYLGLVEVGVGLLPAGTGCMRIAAQAAAASGGHDDQLLAALTPRFEQVAKGAVSGSAADAQRMGYLPAHATVVMRGQRRFHVAKWKVLALWESGYMPPVPRPIRVLGSPGFAALKVGVHQMLRAGYATDYDRHLAERIAFVLTGGDLSGAQEVTEQYLLNLERSEFIKLLQKKKTQERAKGMLSGTRVRN